MPSALFVGLFGMLQVCLGKRATDEAFALIACSPNYELLRPVLAESKRRYPEPSRSSAGFPFMAS
jgi:hypothetical protein